MRRTALGVAGLLLASTLTACGGGGSGADDAAARAAGQLAAGKLAGTVWDDAATAQQALTKVTAGLGDLHPTVHVDTTRTSGDHATATLSWSWPVQADHPWTYSTKLGLAKHGDAWTATWAPDVVEPGLGDGDRLRAVRVPATRGEILGAGGAQIVTARPVVRFGLDKHQLEPDQYVDSATRLARLLGIGVASYVKEVRATGPKAFVVGLTLRSQDVPAAVQRGYTAIPGAYAQHGTLPLAPSKEFAAPILGTVGEATAEIVKASKGRVQGGDLVGLSGLQRRYDEQLAGSPGVRVEQVDAQGKAQELFSADPVAGKPVRVTLVPRLQAEAERVLAGVGPASALVAIRPSTGAILAAASGPGSKGYNTATYGRYAPGSTFKVVSTLALLRAGLTPRTPVHCTSSITVNGKRFTNDSDYPPSGIGTIPLTTALANSCNTAYISEHGRLHGDDLAQAAAALGLGVDHDTGFPSFFGQAPAPAGETEAAADMIGQGRVLASPMAMATVVASVLAGHAVVPYLLDGQHPTASPAHPLTATEAAELRAMMRAVVTTPTGTGAGLADVPGAPVIAKTGTAEFGDHPPLATHAWMVAGQGDLAVAVFVDRGHTGAGTAGPLLERFLRER
jgi:cell division protein FtsI/penicillin-binding protein 2